MNENIKLFKKHFEHLGSSINSLELENKVKQVSKNFTSVIQIKPYTKCKQNILLVVFNINN